MNIYEISRPRRVRGVVALRWIGLAALAAAISTGSARADEDGISFWLPGTYGSLAAVPGERGWSFVNTYYDANVSAGKNQAFQHGGQIDLGLEGSANLDLFGPTYTFANPVLGGQLSLGMLAVAGQNFTSVDVTLTGP